MPKEKNNEVVTSWKVTFAKIKKEITYYSNLGDEAIKAAENLVINDEKSAEMVTELRKNVKSSLNSFDEIVKTKLEPLTKIIESIRGLVRPVKAKFDDAISIINEKAKNYLMEQQRKEQERLEQERKRLEEEHKKKMIEAMKEGKEGVPSPPPPPPVSKTVNKVTTSTGVSMGLRKIWTYKVVDFSKLPDQYKIENNRMIRAAIASGVRQIEGLEIYQESIVSG